MSETLNLPEVITLWSSPDGQTQFPIFEADGSRTTRVMSYLAVERNGKHYRYGFELGTETFDSAASKFREWLDENASPE